MNKRRSRLWLVGALTLTVSLILSSVAVAQPTEFDFDDFETSDNMQPVGASERFPVSGTGLGDANSDLAFWGNHAIQGHYTGFRIIDISNPADPEVVSDYVNCGVSQTSTTGQQGDVIVWEDLVVRSWDGGAGGSCGDLPGVSGLHVFDISDPTDPEPVGFINLRCGSHTASGIPDPDNDRLVVYSSPASAGSAANPCPGIDVVEISLTAPDEVTLIREVDVNQMCHDIGVILGSAMLAACAGHQGPVFGGGGSGDPQWTGISVVSMHPADGGSIDDPAFLYQQATPGSGIGHSAGFTWDGKVIVVGHEPGGGGQANCQASTPDNFKEVYFLAARTGEQLGSWVLDRPQTNTENCTIHNYNVLPSRQGYLLVTSAYQAGTHVVDFTDPANAFSVGYADPVPLTETGIILGGDWSSYWYNGRIYTSDIRRGLGVWALRGNQIAKSARNLTHLNPQTQEFTMVQRSTVD